MAGLLRFVPRSAASTFFRLERSRLFTHLTAPKTPVLGTNVFVRFKTKKYNDKQSKGDKGVPSAKKELSSLIQPVPVSPVTDADAINVGEEMSGKLDKGAIIKWFNEFFRRPEIKAVAAENGIDSKLFHQAYVSFRRYCVESDVLPVELHITLSDIILGNKHVTDLLPYYLEHARTIFPHLECMDDLKKISDLRQPANWYPEARSIQRKIIFHAGPTNSGKTYHALNRFTNAKTGVYCGPLRLLANEVYQKTNGAGTQCDLITGEERRFMGNEDEPSSHVACTVEMASVTTPYEVAVIDEIQMMRDAQRGWAWTRALFGICAFEVHVCGEASAIDMVQSFAETTGDEFEVRRYKRLTPLKVLDKALGNFNNIEPGDCIVCFSKNDIYHCSRQLEKLGIEAAVIYGTLPAGTKLAQAAKFNNPDHPCKVMVSTDAIGMGLNLNIKRIIFYSMMKPSINKKGEKEFSIIPPSSALQIAGRAGRYATTWEEGEVTTFKTSHLPILQRVLQTKVEAIEQAGLHPTAEQIELFAYHLPNATLSNLLDIFVTLCSVDSDKYFMCNVEDFKFLAEMIEHVPLQLRDRYVFCCAPISRQLPFVCTMFLKFAKRYSRAEPVNIDWLYRQLGWPFPQARTISDLVHLECVFDVLDNYLWLSYRFPDMFPDPDLVREMERDLDELIQDGIFNITRLLRNSETGVASGTPDDDDNFEVKTKLSGRRFGKKNVDMDELGSLEEPEAMSDPRQLRRGLDMNPENQSQNPDEFENDISDPRMTRRSFSASKLTGMKKSGKAESFSDRFKKAQGRVLSGSAFDSRLKEENLDMSSGKRLTDQLLQKGLLTEEMLEKIREEIINEEESGHNGGKDDS